MHIVTYKHLQLMLLMLCASFDRNLLMTFTVIVEKLLAYFFVYMVYIWFVMPVIFIVNFCWSVYWLQVVI